MDTIFIRDLRLTTRVGVHAWERDVLQTLRLDVELGLASGEAFRSDDLADAIDYAAVVRQIARFADEQHFQLLERFAEGVADAVLTSFPAAWVKVRVAKLAVVAGVSEVGVAIERHRS